MGRTFYLLREPLALAANEQLGVFAQPGDFAGAREQDHRSCAWIEARKPSARCSLSLGILSGPLCHREGSNVGRRKR
jgi:hypothetical protein